MMLTPTTSEVVEPLEYHKIPGPFKRQTEGPKKNGLESQFGGYAEGLVGVPCGGFLTRGGRRIIVKVKHVDFFGKDFDL